MRRTPSHRFLLTLTTSTLLALGAVTLLAALLMAFGATLAVGATAAPTYMDRAAASHSASLQNKDGDDAGSWRAVEEALTEVRQLGSDEAYATAREALTAYLERRPNGERRTDAMMLYLQLCRMQHDWSAIVEFTQAHRDEVDEQVGLIFTGQAGVAHANLGNRDEAERALARLEAVDEDENDVHLRQEAQRMARDIREHLRFMPGTPAAAFSLPRVDGTGEISLADFEGKFVLLEFWATWCMDCLDLKDQVLQPLWEAYRDEAFVLVSIGIDSAERLAPRIAEGGYDWPMLVDDSRRAARSFGMRGLPYLVLIDREGNLMGRSTGPGVLSLTRRTLAEAFPDAQPQQEETLNERSEPEE